MEVVDLGDSLMVQEQILMVVLMVVLEDLAVVEIYIVILVLVHQDQLEQVIPLQLVHHKVKMVEVIILEEMVE